MKEDTKAAGMAVETISIFFPVPSHEEVAIGIARWLARVAPDSVTALRPETTITQIFKWAEVSCWDTVGVAESFESEFEFELDEFIDDFDRTTLRELVEYAVEGNTKVG